jgi:hypothetical protein
MVYWSMCCNCKQSCLHGLRACDVDISAWASSRCVAPVLPRHVCMVTVSMCFRRHVCLVNVSRCFRRLVCMVYRNKYFSQIFLHGLRELMLLPDISAWSKGLFALPDMFARSAGAYTLLRDMSACCTGPCADPIHVCMVIRSICCSETLGAYAARDMST